MINSKVYNIFGEYEPDDNAKACVCRGTGWSKPRNSKEWNKCETHNIGQPNPSNEEGVAQYAYDGFMKRLEQAGLPTTFDDPLGNLN